MKKLLTISILILTLFLTSCDFFIPTAPTTKATTTTTQITTEEEIIKAELNEGQDTVEINSTWVDAGAKLVVNETEYEMDTTNSVDVSTLGLYEITYTYEYNDNTYEVIRYVIVVDQTRPVITLNPGIDTIKVGDNWVDAGASVTDNSDETLTIVTTGEVDTSTAGTYQITYTATDSSGNTLSIIRFVTVIE